MIETIKEFEDYLLKNFNAEISSYEELKSIPDFYITADNEHDYNHLAAVYKIKDGSYYNSGNPVYMLLFSKDGNTMYDSKQLGRAKDELDSIWLKVKWND